MATESEIKVTASTPDLSKNDLSLACNRYAEARTKGELDQTMKALLAALTKPGSLSLLLDQDDHRLEGLRKTKLKRFQDRERQTIDSAEYLAQNPDYLDLI